MTRPTWPKCRQLWRNAILAAQLAQSKDALSQLDQEAQTRLADMQARLDGAARQRRTSQPRSKHCRRRRPSCSASSSRMPWPHRPKWPLYKPPTPS